MVCPSSPPPCLMSHPEAPSLWLACLGPQDGAQKHEVLVVQQRPKHMYHGGHSVRKVLEVGSWSGAEQDSQNQKGSGV